MPQPAIRDLLLAQRLDQKDVATLLSPFGFKYPQRVDENLQAMAGEPAERQLLAHILEEVLACASKSGDPDQAINYLERFARAALNRTRLFTYLNESPLSLEILARTLGGSPYMAEILIRDPQHFYWVTDPNILGHSRTKREVQRDLVRTLKALGDSSKQLDYLRFFKRRETLHIGVRDLLRLCSVEETLLSLSALAEGLISSAYWICARSLRHEYGISKNDLTAFTVLAMGKLGGGELNFSSDVDLLYVCGDNQNTSVDASEYFRRLAQRITTGLNDFTSEGYVYRVDLRLRPEGHAGDIVYSIDGFRRYYQSRLGAWERLALLKAQPVAGNRQLGATFLKMAKTFIYDVPFDNKAIADILSMKRKSDDRVAARDQRSRNVKLGTGGIREIELITQSLQVRHGEQLPALRERNTVKALAVLRENSLLSLEDSETLTRAYIFLRDVENKLQMVNDAQTHSLPRDHEELTICARLLGFDDPERFLVAYQHHTGWVNRIFQSQFAI
jgi:[glutamine synthetase] adenylyltransferase / [glutamine synthetase]-adenylyl-L-tyrosine phosphorylase